MENPTPNGDRASGVLFPNWTPISLSLSAFRAQHLAARYGLTVEAAAIVAALAFSGAAR